MSSTSNSMDKCAYIIISVNAIIKNSLANGTMTNMDANRIRNMLIKIKTNTELLNSINNFNDFFSDVTCSFGFKFFCNFKY